MTNRLHLSQELGLFRRFKDNNEISGDFPVLDLLFRARPISDIIFERDCNSSDSGYGTSEQIKLTELCMLRVDNWGHGRMVPSSPQLTEDDITLGDIPIDLKSTAIRFKYFDLEVPNFNPDPYGEPTQYGLKELALDLPRENPWRKALISFVVLEEAKAGLKEPTF